MAHLRGPPRLSSRSGRVVSRPLAARKAFPFKRRFPRAPSTCRLRPERGSKPQAKTQNAQGLGVPKGFVPDRGPGQDIPDLAVVLHVPPSAGRLDAALGSSPGAPLARRRSRPVFEGPVDPASGETKVSRVGRRKESRSDVTDGARSESKGFDNYCYTGV